MKYKSTIKTNLNLNDIYSKNNLPKIKYGAYVINLDEYKSIGTHWRALYVDTENVTFFNSFGVGHISEEIKNFIGNKNIITNIYRIQAYDSVMCGYFCTGFIGRKCKVCLIIQTCFLLMIMKRMIN